MAIPPIVTEIIGKFVIALVFTAINCVIIREIATLFGAEDESFSTGAAVAVWIGVALFISSFLGKYPIVAFTLSFLTFLFMIYLMKRYYSFTWNNALLMFLAWMSILIYLALIIYAVTLPRYILAFLGLIPLGLNLGYVYLMRLLRNWTSSSNAKAAAGIAMSIIGFVLVNVGWYLVFKIYFPI